MPQHIRILFLEDNPAHVDLFLKPQLQRQNVDYTLLTCSRKSEFEGHLRNSQCDVIVADFKLPDFDGMEAIRMAKEIAPDVPVILFTGAAGEETAVECLKAGAEDYVMKTRPMRLVPAILNAMEKRVLLKKNLQAEEDRRHVEDALKESEERYRNLVEAFNDIVLVTDHSGRIAYANPSLEHQTGLTPQDLSFILPDDASAMMSFVKAFIESGENYSQAMEHRVLDHQKNLHWYSTAMAKTTYMGKPALQFIMRNITEQKIADEKILASMLGRDLVPIDVSEITASVAFILSDRAVEKNLSLKVEFDDNCRVCGDGKWAHEIAHQLIANAITYSSAGKALFVSVKKHAQEGTIVLTVRDEGPGMPSQLSISNRSGGVGLWLVKQYVEAMKGSIRCETGKDSGTAFIVEFPEAK